MEEWPLPCEPTLSVTAFLPPTDALRFSCCSKFLHRAHVGGETANALWSEFYARDFLLGQPAQHTFASYHLRYLQRAEFLRTVEVVQGNIIHETQADIVVCPSHPELLDLGIGAQHAIRNKVGTAQLVLKPVPC